MSAVYVIESIFSVSYAICSNYKSLAQLESNSLEGTKKYNTLLKGTKLLKEIESKLYNIYFSVCNAGITENKRLALEAINNLSKKTLTNNFEKIDTSELIIYNEINTLDLSLLRIINRVTNYDINLQVREKIDNKSLGKNGLIDPKIIKEVILTLTKKMNLIKTIDNIERILNIEIIDNRNDEETRKKLVKAKYDYYSMFEHNFNMLGYEEFKKQISIVTRDNLIDFLKDKMSKINIETSFTKENKRKILLTTTYIRAKLLNVDDEDKEILKKQIQNLIDQQRIQDSYVTKLFIKLIDQSYYDKDCENTLGL